MNNTTANEDNGNGIDAEFGGGRRYPGAPHRLKPIMPPTRLIILMAFASALPLWGQSIPTPGVSGNLPSVNTPSLDMAIPQLPQACAAEIGAVKPKIYIGNFLVTYGKKDMGKAIGDYMAERFIADGRFDVIPREEINEEMNAVLKKNMKANEYLTMTLGLALERKADCVIFGRISKKGNTVSFLVRMASTVTGENKRKVDTDVERDEALKFLETVGDSFVSYFVTAPPPVVAKKTEDEEKPKDKGRKKLYAGGNFAFSLPFGFIKDGFSYALGGEGVAGIRDMGVKGLHLGVTYQYLGYKVKDDKFVSLNQHAAMAFAGFEIDLAKTFWVMPVLYGGFTVGNLVGQLDSIYYKNPVFGGGVRVGMDIGANLAVFVEPRAELRVDSTVMFSFTSTVGVMGRF